MARTLHLALMGCRGINHQHASAMTEVRGDAFAGHIDRPVETAEFCTVLGRLLPLQK